MWITMLGTGNATVTKCYNTCFIFRNPYRGVSLADQYFLVDGGGGNGLLQQLELAHINWRDIRDIFISHKHTDHLLGILWMVRMICLNMKRNNYDGEAYIYGHDEVIDILYTMAGMVLQEKDMQFIGKRLHLIKVSDGESRKIIGRTVTFFDVQSTKAKQFGFSMDLGKGDKLTFLGDEPYNDCERTYAEGSKWLMHEAFCLSSQADIYKPYEKHHSTAKDAARLAESLGVKNLILYHTEDKTIENRKLLYTADGAEEFSGNIFVPDDLEKIVL